jgi:tetratricopeptide (TPR) repeat protein
MLKFDEAIAIYKEISATSNIRQLDAIFCASYAMMEKGKPSDAADLLAKIDDASPELRDVALLGRAAQYMDRLGKFEEAKADLREIIAKAPAVPEALQAHILLAEILAFHDRNTGDARDILKQMISKFPNYKNLIRPTRCLAECDYLEGKYAEAVKLFEKAISYPDDGNWYPYLLFVIGDCYSRIGEEAKSMESYQKLIATYPKDSWTTVAQTRIANSQEVAK